METIDRVTAVFDSREILNIRLLSKDGDRFFSVRHLSDDEWWQRICLGTDAGPDPKVDLKLLKTISQKPDEQADEAEATYILDYIIHCVVKKTSRDGGAFTIQLTVLGHTVVDEGEESESVRCTVQHALDIPTLRQVADFRRQMTQWYARSGWTRVRSGFDGGAALYDSLARRSWGYADGSRIPLSHKWVAVRGLVAAVNAELAAEEIEPTDF